MGSILTESKVGSEVEICFCQHLSSLSQDGNLVLAIADITN